LPKLRVSTLLKNKPKKTKGLLFQKSAKTDKIVLQSDTFTHSMLLTLHRLGKATMPIYFVAYFNKESIYEN
jgi:hypothetical protein